MAHRPAAFSCHAASPSCTRSPNRWTAKSTIVVVPPHAAAAVPVSNVSDANVPPNGSSMWVCTSTPPGTTYLPVASMTRSAVAARSWPSAVEPGATSAAIVSPSMSTSARARPVALTTVPPVISVVMAGPPSRRRDRVVLVRAPVPVELPRLADPPDRVEVDVAHDDLALVGARDVAHVVAVRADEVRRAVERHSLLAELVELAADPVVGADEVAVRDRGRRLLELPQPVGDAGGGGGRVEHQLRTGEAEHPPALGEVPVVADVDADPP